MNRPISVLLPAIQIPIGSKVTKLRGEKVYIIKGTIRIYGANGERNELAAPPGTRFLCPAEGDINGVAGDTQLVWQTNHDTLARFLRHDPNRDDPFRIMDVLDEQVTIPVEIEVNALRGGRYNATITVPISGEYARTQPVFPFTVDADGAPALPGESGGDRVLRDLLQSAVLALKASEE